MTESGIHPEGSSARTSETLLQRVRAQDQDAWRRFVRLYSPLVYRWCRQAGLQRADALDVGQEVFRAVARTVGDYRHDRPGDTLRGWLWAITRNKLQDFSRRQARAYAAVGGSTAHYHLQQLAESESASAEPHVEYQERLLVYRRAVEMVLAECEERTRQAFWRTVVEGQSTATVAQDLGLSVNAIYVLKSRLLRRVREEFEGCIEL